MNENSTAVERMFPFVLRSRILLVGRDILARSKGKLHFVLLTTDLSEKSRERMLQDFSFYPVVQKWTSAELETFFGVKGAKVIGFKKSGLAQSIYAELKSCRINKPMTPAPRLPREAVEKRDDEVPGERRATGPTHAVDPRKIKASLTRPDRRDSKHSP
jgi:hypothetical protein